MEIIKYIRFNIKNNNKFVLNILKNSIVPFIFLIIIVLSKERRYSEFKLVYMLATIIISMLLLVSSIFNLSNKRNKSIVVLMKLTRTTFLNFFSYYLLNFCLDIIVSSVCITILISNSFGIDWTFLLFFVVLYLYLSIICIYVFFCIFNEIIVFNNKINNESKKIKINNKLLAWFNLYYIGCSKRYILWFDLVLIISWWFTTLILKVPTIIANYVEMSLMVASMIDFANVDEDSYILHNLTKHKIKDLKKEKLIFFIIGMTMMLFINLVVYSILEIDDTSFSNGLISLLLLYIYFFVVSCGVVEMIYLYYPHIRSNNNAIIITVGLSLFPGFGLLISIIYILRSAIRSVRNSKYL